jgi:hypothetical protein
VHGFMKPRGEYHLAQGVRADRQHPARHEHQETLQTRSAKTDTEIYLLNFFDALQI